MGLSVLPENHHNEDPGVNSDDDDYDAEIASLQSRDQPCRQETGHSERLSLRLPPLTEDESSVYSYAEGITNERLSLERKHRRSTRPDGIRTPWRSGGLCYSCSS